MADILTNRHERPPAGLIRRPARVWLTALTDPPIVLWLIVLLALCLRVYQASNHALTSDELANVRVADRIQLSVSDPQLVLSGPDHPLLNVYLAHAGTVLLGKTLLGYRAAVVLLGTFSCWAVYLLTSQVATKRAGLFAAALLAVDQFHTTLSGSVNSNDVLVICFGTLAMVSCVRLTPAGGLRPFLTMGVWLGLAYLGKETALILLPAFWGSVLVSRERRWLLRDPRWYVAHLVFLLVIAPDLWNIATTGGFLEQSATKAFGSNMQVQGKALSLFFGELLMLFRPDAFGSDGEYWCWPLRTMHWVAGGLYVFCTVWSWRDRQRPGFWLLHLCFWAPVCVVTVLPGREIWDPFWWASGAITPAVVFSGIVLCEILRRSRRALWVIAPLFAWLLVRTIQSQMGPYCFPGA